MNIERLKDIREDKDYKQKNVASILGITIDSISKWETGKQAIPLNKLYKFANYFEVNIDYVLGLTNDRYCKNNKKDLNAILLGSRLKTIRKNLGLSQKDLADFLNTTQSTISAYESGKTMLLTEFAYQIASKYNISIDYLCGRNDKEFIKEPVSI